MSFWYLASPYSKYPGGHNAAFEEISRNAGLLLSHGVHVYCPIAHSHPISLYGDVSLDSYDIWLPADKAIFQFAEGMIVCMMDSWQTSHGVNWEIKEFTEAGKPIVYMVPGVLPDIFKKVA